MVLAFFYDRYHFFIAYKTKLRIKIMFDSYITILLIATSYFDFYLYILFPKNINKKGSVPMHNLLVVFASFFLFLTYISFVSLGFFVYKMEKFKKTIFKKDLPSPEYRALEHYKRILKYTNFCIFLGLTIGIVTVYFLYSGQLLYSFFSVLSQLTICLLGLKKWYYIKEMILNNYLILNKNNKFKTYSLTDLKEQSKVLSWQIKMIYLVYITICFAIIALITGYLTKLI